METLLYTEFADERMECHHLCASEFCTAIAYERITVLFILVCLFVCVLVKHFNRNQLAHQQHNNFPSSKVQCDCKNLFQFIDIDVDEDGDYDRNDDDDDDGELLCGIHIKIHGFM